MSTRSLIAPIACLLALMSVHLFASDVPKPLKSRFIVGDPIWREIPLRTNFRAQPEKCWQTAVSTILDNNFDIATMDKDSGYIRTTWNEGVVVMGGHWAYKVQISLKLVPDPAAPKTLDKLRVQVTGELAEANHGRIRVFLRGYDQILLQNLFQDLQAKLGLQ